MAQAPRAVIGLLALLFVFGCGGGPSPGGAAPDQADPRATIDQFMTASKEDNLVAMSRLWGTEDGPAADRMDRVELERRLRVMQVYLENDRYEVTLAEGELLSRSSHTAHFQVRITRRNCTPVIPFTLVLARGGQWLIENIDLAKAGNPERRCPRGTR